MSGIGSYDDERLARLKSTALEAADADAFIGEMKLRPPITIDGKFDLLVAARELRRLLCAEGHKSQGGIDSSPK